MDSTQFSVSQREVKITDALQEGAQDIKVCFVLIFYRSL